MNIKCLWYGETWLYDAGRPLNEKQEQIHPSLRLYCTVGVSALGHMAVFLWLPSQLWFWLFPLLKCNFPNISAPLTYSRVPWTTVSRQTSITVIAFQPWNTELAVAGQMGDVHQPEARTLHGNDVFHLRSHEGWDVSQSSRDNSKYMEMSSIFKFL